jgi:hypothetical protein
LQLLWHNGASVNPHLCAEPSEVVCVWLAKAEPFFIAGTLTTTDDELCLWQSDENAQGFLCIKTTRATVTTSVVKPVWMML